MEIYEKIRYYREHTDYSQRNVAKILGVSRNTVKKYWEGQTVPWERKPGSSRKNDIITDEVKSFIIKCIESDKKAPRKQNHTKNVHLYNSWHGNGHFDASTGTPYRPQ